MTKNNKNKNKDKNKDRNKNKNTLCLNEPIVVAPPLITSKFMTPTGSFGLPFVSVCMPTFNRRPFIPIAFEMFKYQTYPQDKMELIIVDDGTDKIKDLVEASGITNIKYIQVEKKMSLGAKRNYMHTFCKGSYIVYFDDDDMYPPERISHAVGTLMKNPNALCAGSSQLFLYFKHIQKMYQCGPYGPNHATAATFAFRRELLNHTQYDENACLAEERGFLKEYTIPFVQLDPMKSILVFSHAHNSFDKRNLLDNPHPHFFKESTVTVDTIIDRTKYEHIYNFFMHDIDLLLENYDPGHPKHKPDVLTQIEEIKKKRETMAIQQQQERQQQNKSDPNIPNLVPPILLTRPGSTIPTPITQDEVIYILKTQQEQIQKLIKMPCQKCGCVNEYTIAS